MIRGVVNSRPGAIIRLRVLGPGGLELEVDAVVDTGFDSALTPPMATVAALGLDRRRGGTATLADGVSRPIAVYTAEVLWGDAWQTVFVPVVGDFTLLGMRMLEGYELRIAVVPGGAVEITPIS